MADQESETIFTQTELDELEDLENWNLKNIEDGTISDEPATSEIGDFKEEILESDIPCEHDELSTCSKCDIFTQLLSGPNDEMSNAESQPQDEVNVIHPFTCEVCSETFVFRVHLLEHEKYHANEILSCSLCDQKFRGHFDLTKHEREIHSEFQCSTLSSEIAKPKLMSIEQIDENPKDVDQVSHKLSCSSCDKKFEDKWDLRKHEKKIHGYPLVCLECGNKFKRVFELKRHDDEVHKNLRTYECQQCNKIFSRKTTLKSHEERRHKIKDGKVHEKLDVQTSTEKDKKKTIGDEGPFICLQCNKEFSTESYFRQHKKTKFHYSKSNKNDADMPYKEVKTHSSYSCSSCNEIFFDTWDLRKHQMKIHASPIVCTECGKKFRRAFELKRHEDEVHKNLRTYDCEVCGKSFPRKSCLKSHQQRVHEKEDNLKLKKGTDGEKASEEVNYNLSCRSCNEKFKNEWDLRKHKIKIHACPIMCLQCGQTFQKACDLKRHEVEIHHNLRKYKCPICYKSFNRKFCLKSHEQRIHNIKDGIILNMKMDAKEASEDAMYGCSGCDDQFIDEWDLRKHQMKSHGSPIMCSTCDQTFNRPSDLKRHEDEVHQNLRTFKCTSCDKTFPRKTSLKSHEKLHAKRQVTELWKPYACPKCDKRFTADMLVKKHLIEIHMYWMGSEKINPDFTEEKIELI